MAGGAAAALRAGGALHPAPPAVGGSGPPTSAQALAAQVAPECWLLVRRDLTSGELAFYVCAGPAGRSLVALAKVAGCRWPVEETFQAAKGPCGLDEPQVRRWVSWYRWVTLSMLATAFLVVAALTERTGIQRRLGGRTFL